MDRAQPAPLLLTPDLAAAEHPAVSDRHHLLTTVVAQSTTVAAPPQGVMLGTLVELDSQGQARISVPGIGTLDALCALTPLSTADIGRSVAVGFDGSAARRAIVLGLVWPAPASPAVPAPAEMRIDGERIVIEGRREIELRCGEAALVLSADGSIHLRGHYIVSQASATHRILGGAVSVN